MTRFLRKSGVLALAAIALGATLGGAPASAADFDATPSVDTTGTGTPPPPADSGEVGTLKYNSPSCAISRVYENTLTDIAYVHNYCGKTIKVRIVWKYGADSGCFTLKDGWYGESTVPSVPRKFDGHKTC